MSKQTIVIVYNSGSYGTYLEWCLTTLTSNNNIQAPFTKLGSSHLFQGNNIDSFDNWQNYVDSPKNYQFARIHPKNKKTHNFVDNLCTIAQDSAYVIYITPDKERWVLGINNYFYKVFHDYFERLFTYDFDINIIYQRWPVEPGTPHQDIPVWVKREFLSYYLMPAWLDQIEWGHQISHPKIIQITVGELLFDFENTLSKIEQFCGLTYQRPVQDLQDIHSHNLKLQQYIHHDQLCHDIVDSISSQSEMTWSTLSLPSEAWIQWELRNQGWKIRCHGLDIFPTSSVQLRELLYTL